MKAVWTSVILLIILLIGVFWNAHYIQSTSKKLYESADALTINSEDTLHSLEAFWAKNKNLLGISVSFRILDHFGEILSGLRWAKNVNDVKEFERYRLLLCDAIEELEHAEQMNWQAIF